MRPSFSCKFRRRHTSCNDGPVFKKDNQQEHAFFGNMPQAMFFKPAPVAARGQTMQRKCAACEQEEKKVQRAEDKKEEEKPLQRSAEKKEEERPIQKKESNATAMQPGAGTAAFVRSLNGNGTAMPSGVNRFFTARMGFDFSGVKIHTGKAAEESAAAVHAKAYTVGDNIVFNEGQYNPQSTEGRRLLAHELTHVMQQNGAQLLRRAIEPEQETPESAVPTFSSREEVLQNTRHFADCNGVTVQGYTDANYSNSFTAPGSSVPGGNCAECSPDDCVTNTGTVISVFRTNPVITLPAVPAGLNACEQRAVQQFINTTLRAHEQQHVAAFNTYRGTVRTPYTYRGCAGGLEAYTQQVHDTVESTRKSGSDAASAALDANGANIFTVTCNCPDPKTANGSE